MKVQFSAVPTRSITFSRGAEFATFELTAMPIGYFEFLQGVFPEPIEYVNAKPQPRDDPDYWSLFGYLQLAKALEPSGVLDSTPPGDSRDRKKWETYAREVRQEFRDANFQPGEVNALLEALTALARANVKAGNAAGND